MNVFISCEHRYFTENLGKYFYQKVEYDIELKVGDTVLCDGSEWKAIHNKRFKMKIENRVIDMINNHLVYECELLLIE